MERLKCGTIDFNDTNKIQELQTKIQSILDESKNYYPLNHTKNFYFSTPVRLPEEAGWYIILDGILPIYVGKAKDLNARLNTDNGSLDNFNNSNRSSDPERNFIKKYTELGLIQNLRVCIITESSLEINKEELNDKDRDNIEKHLNIWRCFFNYNEQNYDDKDGRKRTVTFLKEEMGG
jgi:hypothetical protein